MANCIYELPKIYRPKKKLFISVQIYRKDVDSSESYSLYFEFFFTKEIFVKYAIDANQ